MQAADRESLKRLHRFDEWAGRSALPQARLTRPLAFAGDAVPGLRVERVDRRDAEEPPRSTVFWRRGDTPAVVRTDLFECASVQAAHEYLIDALNEFESAAIERRPNADFGDVAFGTDSVALFARANLVVLVRKATPQREPVGAVAQAIDALLRAASR